MSKEERRMLEPIQEPLKEPQVSLTLVGKLQEAVKLANGKYKVHGIAIHPKITYHPAEFAQRRVYLEERLKQAVPSLIGKPILEDHRFPLFGCRVTNSTWDTTENGVGFEAEVTEEVAKKVREGYYPSVSITINPWIKGGGVEQVNGIAPFGFEFDEVSFLHKLTPGDPEAWVKLMEALFSEEGEFTVKVVNDINSVDLTSLHSVWIDQQQGVQSLWGRRQDGTDVIVLISFANSLGWTPERVDEFFRLHPEYRRLQPTLTPPTQTPTQTPVKEPLVEAKKENTPSFVWVRLGKDWIGPIDKKLFKHIHSKRD